MASRPALICQKDVTRIVKGAAAAGITMGIVVKNGEVRFLPVDQIKSTAALSDLEQWRTAKNAGETDGPA